MVLLFYPAVTVPYIVRTILLFNWVVEKVNHQIKCLQSWIVVVMSKIQEALMLFGQSTIRPLLDPIVEKMNSLSEALKMCLTNDAVMGQPTVKLICKFALSSAKILSQDSELRLKYDKSGKITACFALTCLFLVAFSESYGKKLKILYRRWGCTANSTSNFTWFILALPFQTYYGNSLKSLGVAFCLTIFNLSLSVVLRLPTDFGFFGFIIGVVGSITYNRFGLNFPTWIVACICYLIFCLKSWLEKHWLDFEEDLPLPSTCTVGSSCLIRRIPQSFLFLALSCARDDIRPQLLQRISWYIMVILCGIWGADGLRRGAPKDDRLPPYTRFTRRTHYAYYRFMICSLALDFLYVLGISVSTYVHWPSIYAMMLAEMCFYACRYVGHI
ncbi:hypothetical protein SLEP1_g49139 [Rubroshorea leprosula]|uniref:Uncharacterized protein n=1 Tax=Rubroshorea leprosula TaxID=152421 RepID=A0AAV5LVX7_9ROSI|nr:hypothetical protein SLEP1_g49139 [Rubroshorea leprosula]